MNPRRLLRRCLFSVGVLLFPIAVALPSRAGSAPPSLGAPNGLEQPHYLTSVQLRALQSVTTDSPGANLQLGGKDEPTLAVNRFNTLRVAVANNVGLRVSVDGGVSFLASVTPVMPADYNFAGDPSLAYDSQGRLFWTFLGRQVATGALHLFIAQCSPTTGEILPGYPVNIVGAQAGGLNWLDATHDKEWIAIDPIAGHAQQDRIQLVWTYFSKDTADVTRIYHSFSDNQGVAWAPALALSGPGEGFVWPAHVHTANDGDVFVAYHATGDDNATEGRVYLLHSNDGGGSFDTKELAFGAGEAGITFNRQDVAGTIPGARFWTQGSFQAWVITSAQDPNRVVVIACDDPDDDFDLGDASDVYKAVSGADGAAGTWDAPVRISGGGVGDLQVFPTAAVDPKNGTMVVHYYDDRRGLVNGGGFSLLDVLMVASFDGGVEWSSECQVNDAAFDPDPGAPIRFPGPPATTRIGEYNGVAVTPGFVFAVWTGNVFDIGGAPIDQQSIFQRIPIRAPALAVQAGTNGIAEFATAPLTPPRAGASLYGNGLFIANGRVLLGPGDNFSDLGPGANNSTLGNQPIINPYQYLRIGPAPFGVASTNFCAIGTPAGGGILFLRGTYALEPFGPNPDAIATVNVMRGSATLRNTGPLVLTRPGSRWGQVFTLPPGAYGAVGVRTTVTDPISGAPLEVPELVLAADGDGGILGNGIDLARGNLGSNIVLAPLGAGKVARAWGVSGGRAMFWPPLTNSAVDVTVTMIADPGAELEYAPDEVPDTLSVPDFGGGEVPGEATVAVPPPVLPTHATDFSLRLVGENPTRDRVRFELVLPLDDQVTVEILDVQGRVTETLLSGRRGAGRHALAWNAGQSSPSGLYFARLRWSAGQITTRVIIVH